MTFGEFLCQSLLTDLLRLLDQRRQRHGVELFCARERVFINVLAFLAVHPPLRMAGDNDVAKCYVHTDSSA